MVNDSVFKVQVVKFCRFQKYIRMTFTKVIKLLIRFTPLMRYKIDLIMLFRPDNFFLVQKMCIEEPNMHNNIDNSEIPKTNGLSLYLKGRV